MTVVQNQREQFFNIDFLRIAGTILVINHHIWQFAGLAKINTVQMLKHNSSLGYIWVEFFYILAGFMLMYTMNGSNNIEWVSYTIKRAKRLWFPIAISLLAVFIISLFGITKFNQYDDIMILLFLQSTGLMRGSIANNGFIWFVGPLFFMNLFYSYIKLNYARKTLNLLSCILAFISYAILVNKGNCFAGIGQVFYNFLPVGMIRGIGGVSAGIILYNAYDYYKTHAGQLPCSILKKLFITGIETYLLIFVINNTVFHRLSYKNDFLMVLIFCLLIWLFIMHKGYISSFLNNKIWKNIGKYSYNIYVMQAIILIMSSWLIKKYNLMNYLNTELNLIIYAIIILLVTTITGIINYHICDLIYKKLNKNKI